MEFCPLKPLCEAKYFNLSQPSYLWGSVHRFNTCAFSIQGDNAEGDKAVYVLSMCRPLCHSLTIQLKNHYTVKVTSGALKYTAWCAQVSHLSVDRFRCSRFGCAHRPWHQSLKHREATCICWRWGKIQQLTSVILHVSYGWQSINRIMYKQLHLPIITEGLSLFTASSKVAGMFSGAAWAYGSWLLSILAVRPWMFW